MASIRSQEELLTWLVRKVRLLERRLARRGGSGAMTGEMKIWAGATAPDGWMLLQGQTLLIADHPALYAVIGTQYGGNGTTNFMLPDLRGRVIVGQDTSQTEFDVLGEKSGAKTHTLSQAEMPSHTHTQNPHFHGGAGGGQFVQSGSGGAGANVAVTGSGYTLLNTANATATNQNTGGGGAHNNLQPYIVMNHIIKV